MVKLPLEGIRVIDFGTMFYAGPYTTMILGDLGAEVIRVESLQRIDVNGRGNINVPPGAPTMFFPNSDPGARPWERQSSFNMTARHKRSMTVDYFRPEGKEIFFKLVKVSDVLVENSAGGTMDKLGLGWPVLSKVNPQLVMASLAAFGNTGPYRSFRGPGSAMEGVAGHHSLRYYPDMGISGTPYGLQSDAGGAASGTLAVLLALYYRSVTGKGQFIDMSQSENVAQHLSQALMDYSMNRRVQRSLGNRHPVMAPHGCYPCKGEDQWCVIAVGTDEQFQALCQAMGRPDLLEDPRFADALNRHRHQDDLDEQISAWTRTQEHRKVMELLQPLGVPAGPVLTHAELFQDPHLKERGFFEVVTNKTTGSHPYPAPYFKMSKTPLHIRHGAPALGQDNEYVYKQLLGYRDEEYRELIRKQHVGDTYVALLEQAKAGGS